MNLEPISQKKLYGLENYFNELKAFYIKDKLPNKSGVLTPSVAMGDSLLTRLEKNAGLKFSFES